jgi:putative addiction module component (TIGR02574 family)
MKMKIDELSVDERLRLVEDIWDSIAAEQDRLPLTTKQRQQLDFRLEAYRLDKNPGIPGFEAIERIRNRLRTSL